MREKDVFKFDNDELEKLAKADLPYPDNLAKQINKMPPRRHGTKRTRYIAFYEMFEEKFIERTFAFREEKGKLQYKEVMRQIEGNYRKLIKDMYLAGIGGYNTIWKGEEKRINYQPITADGEWFRQHIKYYNVYSKAIYEFKQLVKMDSSIKYCGYDYGMVSMYLNFVYYISWFRKMPEIEMYSKMGFLHLLTDSRFYNRIKKDKAFRKYVAKNNIGRYGYVDILNAYKRNMTIEQYMSRKNVYSRRFVKENKDIFTEKRITRLLEYLKKQRHYEINYYADYFQAAKQFVNMNDTKHLFPNNLEEQHDLFINQLRIKKHEDKKEAFEKVVEKWSWLNYENSKFTITLAPTIESIIEEGKLLKHCVAKLGYIEKMVKEKTLIMFIRKLENTLEPFYTVEFDPKKKEIIQCRGKNNQQNEMWDEIVAFRQEWKSKLKFLKIKQRNKKSKLKKAA